jgi:hypothetical protein
MIVAMMSVLWIIADAIAVLQISRAGDTASPPPLAGEGQGEGMREESRVPTLSPPLSRKREREQTELVAPAVAHQTRRYCATVLPGHLHKSAMMHFSHNGRRATQT